MKYKPLLLLFSISSLSNSPSIHAYPEIVVAVDMVHQGASYIGLTYAPLAGIALGHLARFGVAELGIFANLALSLGIKKDTTLIRRALTTMSTNVSKIHQDLTEHALKSSHSHQATQESIRAVDEKLSALTKKIMEGSATLDEIKILSQLHEKKLNQIISKLDDLESRQKSGNSMTSKLLKIFRNTSSSE